MKYIFIGILVFIWTVGCSQIGMTLRRDRVTAAPPVTWSDFIAHYDFNGDANDNVSPASDGTVSGATLVNGKDGISNTAYETDGINDYIEIPDDSKFNFSSLGEFTISVWVEFVTVNSGTLIYKGSTTTNREYYMTCDGRFRYFDNSACTSDNQVGITTTPGGSGWRNFIYTLDDDDSFKVYINGTLHQSISTSSAIGDCNSPLNIGRYGGGSVYGNLRIDDLKIWDRELTTDEILSIYTTENLGL